MHLEAYLAIMGMVNLIKDIQRPTVILEVGSREVSGGGVKHLFHPYYHYYGIDLKAGDGVDEVIDFLDFTSPIKYQAVVCCEVLEHHPEPIKIVQKAYDTVIDGGWAMFTFAGPNRPPHSTEGKELPEGEYYRNISGEEAEWMFKSVGFKEVSVDYPVPRPPHTSFFLKYNEEQLAFITDTVKKIDTYVLARKVA
jgi:SAM-dependent methyltransferase